MDRQGDLFAPAPIRVADRHVAAAERPRLSRQSAAILERLRQGPTTNGELSEIACRYGARLYDLRRAGFTIEIIRTDEESGERVYALQE